MMSESWKTRFKRSVTVRRFASGAQSLSTAVNGPMSISFFASDLMSSYANDCFVSRRIWSWLMMRRMSLFVVSIRASIAASFIWMPSCSAMSSIRLTIWPFVGRENGMSRT